MICCIAFRSEDRVTYCILFRTLYPYISIHIPTDVSTCVYIVVWGCCNFLQQVLRLSQCIHSPCEQYNSTSSQNNLSCTVRTCVYCWQRILCIRYSCELHPESTKICTCVYFVLGIINTVLKNLKSNWPTWTRTHFPEVLGSSGGYFAWN